MKIKSIEKEDRKDISNYLVTFDNDEVVGVEAKSKEEAESKAKEYLESDAFKASHPETES